jgi:hypothetical protein
MLDIENTYQQVDEEVDSQPSTNRLLKLGVAVIGGSCFMLVSIMSQSTFSPASHGAATSLLGVAPSMPRGGAFKPDKMLCGASPWKNLAITALKLNNRRNMAAKDGRFYSLTSMAAADAEVKTKLTEEISSMNATTQGEVAKVADAVKMKARDMAGVTAPLGFFDPLGFSTDCSKGKLLFYREVELKHGRVAMLASLGILVGEQFHPLFGGGIDLPAYITFQFTPLQTFWPAVVAAIAIPEVFSVFTFDNSKPWTLKEDRVPGDFNFDPLGLKPTDPAEFKTMQTKELNNGRLAMIAAAGMLAQELATNRKIFDAPF